MNSSDESVRARAGSISFDFDLRHPPEKVWRALTDPELLAKWLLPAIGLELRPGAAFLFQADPQPGWDGVVSCKCLEIEERRKLRWAWVVGDLDTVVTFTLAPSASGTRLSIVQSGFKPDQKQALGGARYGWKMMSDKLVELLETMQGGGR